jgi:RsiW-degrading membrane proteinase PrsW (M82 family)
MITSDPKILVVAFLIGIVPSLFWLWFWLQEDKKNPEPNDVLSVVFFMGILAVIFVIPIQQFIDTHIDSANLKLILWASAEEVVKYMAVLIILYKTNLADEPIDWPIYMITVALGFAALENALYLIKPIASGSTAVSLLTGNLRFLGSTLLHTVTSGIVGVSLGISVHLKGFIRIWHMILGFLLAVTLHSVFNFFIIDVSQDNFLKVFSFLWVVAIIVMLLFEKVRRIN